MNSKTCLSTSLH